MPKSLAVAGKGGTGKSTIAALLVSELCKRGEGPVLAVDADPDSNLGTLLGLKPSQTIGELRDDLLKDIKNFPAGMTKANYIEAGLHGIIEESYGFDLITMGRGEGASCYCYINSLIRKFCDDLAPSYSWIIMDNEAGLEHLSRRTTVDIDGLIVVVNENPLSFHSAERIEEITEELNGRIRNNYLVTNMIKEERIPVVHNRLSHLKMEFLCDIPYNEVLEEIIFNEKPLHELTSEPVISCIKKIIKVVAGS